MGHDIEWLAVSLGKNDIVWLIIVVDFQQPATCDLVGVGLAVSLFLNIHTMLLYSYFLIEKIQPDVFTVHDDLDRLDVGIP